MTVDDILGDAFKLIKPPLKALLETGTERALPRDDSIGMKAPLNTALTPLVGESEYVSVRSSKDLHASFGSGRLGLRGDCIEW